ncbi:MAG TPA: glycine betaine ABC transporter substrate-binding protein, partial [Pyrinomonadaceae bacterium]|nr:glycine betaine ABC transporter substrate-binding protein [Pyrinomonadaceae bacterium]
GIGARTAIIALALYALLPVIRNTVTGISGIDPKIREAATAMGMTDGQILRMVELPLAMPVMLTGIRVAVVICVGVATVAAAVGAGGLGTYIFRGLRQNDNNLLLAGAIASALLALLCDFGIGQIERAYRIGERSSTIGRRVIGLTVAATFVAIIGFSFISNFKFGISRQAILPADVATTQKSIIRVGSKDFTESIILAEILAQMLEKQGVTVERHLELGGNIPHDSLLSNQIDVYPEYTGTAYTAILKHTPLTDPQAVYDRTKAEYADKYGLVVSPPLGFANDFAILVRGEVARKNNLKTISDVVPLARDWQAGFGQDFMSRTDGYPGFVKAYGLNFARQPREMDLSLTYRALASGELDIIAGNSTDGLISALDLFQLTDDRHYFPPYQAVFVARQDAAETLRTAFVKLNNAITTDDMRRMNFDVDGNKRSPKEVASDWLIQKSF